jgi:proteasome lid subunit RPN8/RPN11
LPERDISQEPPKSKTHEQGEFAAEPKIYPVYVYERTCQDIFSFCLQEAQRRPPREALGVILGFRRQWEDTKYVRVTDWATGTVESSMTYARFTPEGILEYRLALHDRYGSNPHTPRVIGLWHSHPFGGNPQFSSTDINTFFRTPFCAEGNVFFLIDPLSRFFKVYMLRRSPEKDVLQLERVEWCTYKPKVPAGSLSAEEAWEAEEGGLDRA